jgi:hypothetical protein
MRKETEETGDSMNVKSTPGAQSAARGQFARPFSPTSEKIFLLLVLLSGAARAQEASKVTLERIVDGRGNRVCDVARVSAGGDPKKTVFLVRGLVRSDLVFSRETGPEGTTDAIGLDDRPALRFTSTRPGGRMTAASPASSFRYFDQDLSRKTVRCNLSRLVEETDRDLFAAAAEWGLLVQGLDVGAGGPEDAVIRTLLAVQKQAPHPSPPIRTRVPLPETEPGAAGLAAAALAAFTR